jgi:hypothetical protein
MRGITLALVAVLAITSVAAAGPADKPTLSVRPDNYYVGSGMRSFIVSATGTNVNTLGMFSITGGDVYQVFTGVGVISPWIGNRDLSCPGAALDSYVTFAPLATPGVGTSYTGERQPDLPNLTPGTIVGENASVTVETITGGGTAGVGTLANTAGTTRDSYMLLSDPTDTQLSVDLFHLVVPYGKHVDVGMQLVTASNEDANPGWEKSYVWDYTGANIIKVKCPLNGDANEDGIVNLSDLSVLGTNWGLAGGWAKADFTGDGTINLSDLSMLGTNWGQSADWYVPPPGEGTPPGVPEPGTIATLIAGLLCLAGYRLRK